MAIKIQPFWFVLLISTMVSILFSVASTSTSFETTISLGPNIRGGHWNLLHSSIGISAMHMQVLHNNKVIIFDRTDFGPSNLSLPYGHCRTDPYDKALKVDCTAHSLLYDIATNTFRPLTVQTDTWCSSGAVFPDGTLIQTGGYNDGERIVRTFTPCNDDRCDWIELPHFLSQRRWYASNQILPDGRAFVIGGRSVFTYEFFPKSTSPSSPANYYMNFLKETRDLKEENNLYPFLHLLPDGNLFIFANQQSISFDYRNNRVVKEFPKIPGEARNYPSTGSSVLLPIKLTSDNSSTLPETEVLICGGAPQGSFTAAERGKYVEASKTCGRIRVFDPRPVWQMETMPMPRVMSDMLLLPTGAVIIINGATNGSAGWEDAVNPVLNPIVYMPYEPNPVRRFAVLNPSRIPRMYHSAAVLLPDGRILVGGSNPHKVYNFTSYPYPTELSLEAFSPFYLAPHYAPIRPTILTVEANKDTVSYNQRFSVTFMLSTYRPDLEMSVNIVTPSFTTHSLALNQRMVNLNVIETVQMSVFAHKVVVGGPTSVNVAPPGYYMLFLVHAGIPSHGWWVKVQ